MQQKIVLITGGTQGIGQGIASAFLAKNYFAVVCARKTPDKEPFPNFRGKYVFIPADISKKSSHESLISKILDDYHRLDVLINNAGIAPPVRSDILDASEENFDLVLSINLKGPYFLTQLVSKKMILLKKDPKIENYHPSIINIGSISAFTSSTNRGEYCISKAGMAMMTQLYADRLAEYGIPVFEIQPGIISTQMTEGAKEKYDHLIAEGLLPIARWGTPEDIGKAAVALAEGDFPYSTGQVIHIDGGFHMRRL